jgi:hypothetical protein
VQRLDCFNNQALIFFKAMLEPYNVAAHPDFPGVLPILRFALRAYLWPRKSDTISAYPKNPKVTQEKFAKLQWRLFGL